MTRTFTIGQWGAYINQPEMFSWYRLPGAMLYEGVNYRPNGRELQALSDRAYRKLHRETVAYVRESVRGFPTPYHNDQNHFAEVEDLGLEAANAYARGNSQLMPVAVYQALALGLRTHDAHHCGSTLRVAAPRGMYRPELGVHVSSEWVTSVAVNDFMRERGLSFPARLFQTSLIWSSTYGAASAIGKQLQLPNPQPRTVWDAIMRAADVCPKPTFEQWLSSTIAVNYGEVPATPPKQTLQGFIADGYGFMDYVLACFDALDRFATSPSITNELGWRKRVQDIRNGLDGMAHGNTRLIQIARAEAHKYGTTLR